MKLSFCPILCCRFKHYSVRDTLLTSAVKTVSQSLSNLILCHILQVQTAWQCTLCAAAMRCLRTAGVCVCVLPARPREGNEVKKFKKSIIPPAHPRGLSVLKPADENLPFMLILQIRRALKCIFSSPGLNFEKCNFCPGIWTYYISEAV